MHKTQNDLPETNRKKICELLNVRLSEALDLQMQTKHAHWNVKGPQFIALHELFDKIAASYTISIDDMAERITSLGGFAYGTVQKVSTGTTLKEYPAEVTKGEDHIKALVTSTAAYALSVRKAIDLATEFKDADTADLFTGLSRDVDKNLWFLEAHVQ